MISNTARVAMTAALTGILAWAVAWWWPPAKPGRYSGFARSPWCRPRRSTSSSDAGTAAAWQVRGQVVGPHLPELGRGQGVVVARRMRYWMVPLWTWRARKPVVRRLLV